MFRKLLKYDMMAVKRLWWVAAIVVPIAAFLGAWMIRMIIFLSSRGIELSLAETLLMVIAVFTLIACFFAIVLSFVLTLVLVYVRFYKNFFTDEGYLTFTLPASRRMLLLSKTANAFIWHVLHGALLFLGAVIFFLLFLPAEEGHLLNPVVFEEIFKLFRVFWENGAGGWLILLLLELVVWALVSTLQTISLFQLSITIGSVVAKKGKIFASIGFYYAINTAVSLVWQIISSIVVYGMREGISDLFMNATDHEIMAVLSLVILIATAMTGALTSILYNFTQSLLERRLNLA